MTTSGAYTALSTLSRMVDWTALSRKAVCALVELTFPAESHRQQPNCCVIGGKRCAELGIEVKGARSTISDRLESLPTALPLLNDHKTL